MYQITLASAIATGTKTLMAKTAPEAVRTAREWTHRGQSTAQSIIDSVKGKLYRGKVVMFASDMGYMTASIVRQP